MSDKRIGALTSRLDITNKPISNYMSLGSLVCSGIDSMGQLFNPLTFVYH